MQLALYSVVEDESHHNQHTHSTDEVKPFGEPYSHSDFAPKPRKMVLTKERKKDPYISPAILIEYVQW